MPILSTDAIPNKAITVLIYGRPDSGKTTLALSAKNPLILDFDRLAYKAGRKGSSYAKDASKGLQSWDEALALLDDPILDQFDTVVIDTLSTAQDYIIDYMSRIDSKSVSRVGPTKNGWGLLASEFTNFCKRLNLKQKNIVVLAHENSNEVNDITRYAPAIKGSSREWIEKYFTLEGRLTVEGKIRVLDFSYSEDKNTRGHVLGKIDNPDNLQTIIELYFDLLDQQRESREKASETVVALKEKLAKVKTLKQLEDLAAEISTHPEYVKSSLREDFMAAKEKIDAKPAKPQA